MELTVSEDEAATPPFWRRVFVFDVHLLSHLLRLWHSRYLIFALTLRGFRARYKQSLIGVGWALVTPLAMTAVFLIMYKKVKFESMAFPCPKPLYLLLTLSFWNFFSKSVTNGATSLASNMDLVTKVYFPREVLPLSSVLLNLVDWCLSFSLFVLAAAIYTFFFRQQAFGLPLDYPFIPHWGWLWLPILMVLLLMFTMGLVFVVSTMQVYFRDVGHLIGLSLFLWFFVTPIFYPLRAFAGGRYTSIVNINPMTGLIDSFQIALIGRGNPFVHNHVLGAATMAVLVFLLGYSFFKHEERYFADVV